MATALRDDPTYDSSPNGSPPLQAWARRQRFAHMMQPPVEMQPLRSKPDCPVCRGCNAELSNIELEEVRDSEQTK